MQIFKDNQVLLNKMMLIEQKDSHLHPKTIQKNQYDPKSLGLIKRMKDYNAINTENKVDSIKYYSSC